MPFGYCIVSATHPASRAVFNAVISIAHTGMNQNQYVAHLEQLIAQWHLTASGNPEDWANELHKYAQAAWPDNGNDVEEDYYDAQIKVVDVRLALAGLRLAVLLNESGR